MNFVEDLDRLYMAYLQNKHRSEEKPDFNHYLTHLSEVYRACAKSDDPDCVAESTSKPQAKIVMPVQIRDARLLTCNPYLDPYCLFPRPPKAPEEEPAAAPAKVPAPILNSFLPLPLRTPVVPFYAPVVEPFLSAEQRAELLRICSPSDVECLQYHLRAAYGYKPIGPVPSYGSLGCDPSKDPYCWPRLVQRAPSGLYHLYPTCDPDYDPFCVAPPAALAAADSQDAPKGQHCNPLFDEGCNPLSATRLAGLSKPVVEFTPKDEPAAPSLSCDPRFDPSCILAAAAALRRPPPPLPQFQTRHRLGIRGRTKDGHDCYVFYDKDCVPLEAQDERPESPKADCHPFDPSCGRFAPRPAAAGGAAATGIIEPHPDCDPEIDYNCRLRLAEPASNHGDAGAADAAPQYASPPFQDVLRRYLGHNKK
ncbi:actinodin2 [Denticeps clupeoides]|uniref:actinodin2 n=1 Tax=Denticeps clupeoides TaxID=299321 RepID=UPI0010A4910E|nr:uncharacterized protein LOC114787741 [Denticeps clupeoides]